jgi:hypothetical protein
MRVIASVQSKRGSSRGLVHYLAHSKIDNNKEPEKGRELFNAFTEHLTVQNANNFLKSDCGKGRPSNNDLHHMVLSFRQEDFVKLGSTDLERKRRLKLVTRFAMGQLEEKLQSERLAWAGAVHLNTANPHVHIAIQKQYLTKDLKGRTLNKIPRETLPHFEIIDGEKKIVDGILIGSARDKLQELVEGRATPREHAYGRNYENNPSKNKDDDKIERYDGDIDEREILRRGILADYQLKFKEARIAFLIERRESLKFQVTDTRTGMKQKVSLKELESATDGSEGSQNMAQLRQVRAITHSILAKEESEFFKLKNETRVIRKEADQIRKTCKKNGAKLPLPAFNKQELDELQGRCLSNSKIREYLYLEHVRIDLETEKEINARDHRDLEFLAGQKVLSELRLRFQQKQLSDFKDNSYYRKFPVGNDEISLATIDREFNSKDRSGDSALKSIRLAIKSLTNREKARSSKSNRFHLYKAVNSSLNERSLSLHRDFQKRQKVVEVLGDVLSRNTTEKDLRPRFSASELIEIEVLSRRLKLPKEYTANWKLQRDSIIAAGKHPRNAEGISETKDIVDVSHLISGRVIAREVLCDIGLNMAKEDLSHYRKSKRFHKFAIEDKNSGLVSYLSMNDVDLPRNKSVLDQTLKLLLESKEHRQLRRELEGRVKEYEQNLKAGLVAAKELCLEARREAAAFMPNYLSSSVAQSNYQPIFTVKEVAEIENRIAVKSESKEAKRLDLVLERSVPENSSSFNEILTKAMSPETKELFDQKHSSDNTDRIPQSADLHRQNGREINIGLER